MIKIILIGIVAVLISINLKAINAQYSLYIGFAACIIIASYGLLKAKIIIEMIEEIMGIMTIRNEYIRIMIKIAGLTYAGEFTSNICKDAGHQALASQIEFALRLTILTMSLPIITSMIEMIGNKL